jgi:hypothetical protein
MRIDANGNVAIGTTSPDGTLHVHTASAGTVTADANADDLVVENSGNGGISILTPAANVGAIYFGDATAEVRGRVQYDHSTDELALYSQNVSGIRLLGNKVGINYAPGGSMLSIDQDGSADAIPVLELIQADVSEEFVKFIGTAASATLTQTIVAEADVTTATRQGFLKIKIQDNGGQVSNGTYFVPFFSLA